MSTDGTSATVPERRTRAEGDPVRWSDEVDAVMAGDLTAAAACTTRSGGAVVMEVAPCGLRVRDQGLVGFTTSLGLPRRLEHMVADPKVALAFHARDHGFATSTQYVLAQGDASIDLTPSRPRLEAFAPQTERYLGPVKRGPIWDRLLHEYCLDRVFVDIAVTRVVAWPGLRGDGAPETFGPVPAQAPPAQDPPARGTAPRVPVGRLAAQMRRLPHVVLAYRGADGYPVVVPVQYQGHGADGIHLTASPGLLPPGGRRAGFLAHAYRARLIGLSTRFGTGWLDVDDGGRAVYAPHTVHGFDAPPIHDLMLVTNGLMAKRGMRRARVTGLAEQLARAADGRAAQARSAVSALRGQTGGDQPTPSPSGAPA
jgi:hypothetical protein